MVTDHSGEDPIQRESRLMLHYDYVQDAWSVIGGRWYFWNGEGFDLSAGPDLVLAQQEEGLLKVGGMIEAALSFEALGEAMELRGGGGLIDAGIDAENNVDFIFFIRLGAVTSLPGL
jgi:hypothetical protein